VIGSRLKRSNSRRICLRPDRLSSYFWSSLHTSATNTCNNLRLDLFVFIVSLLETRR